jgi:cytochrome c oxidase cbb3-type subunit I/II
VHTNAVIFAFVGNGMFMGIYYSLQRLCKARMFSDFLSWLNFCGWQAIIVAAAITLPLGLTTSKEYAELEWRSTSRCRGAGRVRRQPFGTIARRERT